MQLQNYVRYWVTKHDVPYKDLVEKYNIRPYPCDCGNPHTETETECFGWQMLSQSVVLDMVNDDDEKYDSIKEYYNKYYNLETEKTKEI